MKLHQIKNYTRVFSLCYVKAKRSLLGMALSFTAEVIFSLLYNIYAGKIIDKALDVASTTGDFMDILPSIGVFIGLLIMVSIAENFSTYFEILYNNSLDLILDDYKYHKNLELDPQMYIDPKFTAQKQILEENGWVVPNVGKKIVKLITSFLPMVLYMTVIARYNWIIAVLTLLSAIPVVIASSKFGKIIWGIWDDDSGNRVIWSMYRNALWGNITNVKLLGAGKFIIKRMLSYHRAFLAKIDKNERSRMMALNGSTLVEYIFLAIAYGLLFFGVVSGQFSVGTFAIIASSLWAAKRSIGKFFEQITVLESDSSFIETFLKYMDLEPIIKSPKDAIEISKDDPIEIEFKNVWFKYPRTKKWIFKNLSFKITKDEDVALVGKNGAGKTTLVRLIIRMYDPQKGEILINGIPLKQINLESYYKQVGLLDQEFTIYEFPVDENIKIGNIERKGTKNDVKDAAILADADSFLSELKKGYDTYMTNKIEAGQELSGGQKQRLAIARTFYRQPKLLLMDEPTSAVDSLAEEEIFNNIFKYADDKTVLIISHRFATIKKAQRILVIDRGEIVQQGRHSQLIKKDGLYKKMYDKQEE